MKSAWTFHLILSLITNKQFLSLKISHELDSLQEMVRLKKLKFYIQNLLSLQRVDWRGDLRFIQMEMA
jgi:hypothetical protein